MQTVWHIQANVNAITDHIGGKTNDADGIEAN